MQGQSWTFGPGFVQSVRPAAWYSICLLYTSVTAETTTNFCLVNDSDSSARISYRPEDIFASAVNEAEVRCV